MSRGFTLIELIISISIFVFMTALVVAKYGNFNQSTLLTDTAYEVAIVVRTAQSYGLSVKNADQVLGSTGNFQYPYGVIFNDSSSPITCGGTPSASVSPGTIALFADSYPLPPSSDGRCTSSDTLVSSYVLTRGAVISSLCVGGDASSCPSTGHSTGLVQELDLSFQRPNPDARICGGPSAGTLVCTYQYAEAQIEATDGSLRTVTVRANGQISVLLQ